jgi:3-deoxy-D-arabino-heptulosonate 7-phosphate (DAHP) synthase
MRLAPESPTTAELHEMHPLTDDHLQIVDTRRTRISDQLHRPGHGLVAVVGACALTDNLPTLQAEARALTSLEAVVPGLVTAQRLNTWKPRTHAEDWHGMESTSEVTRAHQIVTEQTRTYGNAAMEVGYPDHLRRYGRSLVLGWIGARNHTDDELLTVAAQHTALPLGVKNGLDESVPDALARVEKIRRIRGDVGAAVVLLYRGSCNAMTPDAWENEYLQAHELTGGQMIVDCAHGSMRAHNGNTKSIRGQVAARDHVLALAELGYAPAGIMMEASDTLTVVDPNMKYAEGLGGVVNLANTNMSLALR